MSESILRSFRKQVAAGRRDAAIETIEKLEESFESDRTITARDDVLATVVRYNSTSGSEPATVADRYVETATELEQARIELNEAILGYLAEETDSEILVGRIDETIAAYEAVRADRESLYERSEEVPLGVVFHLAESGEVRVPYGGSVGFGTTLANLGDSDAASIDVRLDDESIVSTTVSPNVVDRLDAGEEEAIGVSLEGKSTGRGQVRLTATGNDNRDSITVSVEVLDKVEYLSRVDSIAERITSDLDDRLTEKGVSKGRNGIQNRIKVIQKGLKQIIKRIESEKGGKKSVNNRVDAVVNQFESVRNTLTRGSADRFDPAVRSEYLDLIQEAIDLLNESREATT